MKLPTLLMLGFAILFAKEENVNAIEMTEENFSMMEDLLLDVISRVQSMETEKNGLRSQMIDLENENHELKSEVKKLKSEMEEVSDEVECLKEGLEDVNDEVEYLKELTKLLSVRTCDEMHDYGVNKSDYYFVDPDGPLNGKEPIWVYCDFTEDFGFTQISHNSEDIIEVTHCPDPGCYSRPIVYDSSMEQIKTLIELSETCNQCIRYDCYLSPLEDQWVTFGYWVDRNGQNQIYWSGENYGDHVCSCHFSEEGCVSEDTLNNTCNCDSNVPITLFDDGCITNSSALPITELKFGGLNYDTQLGFHTLGKFSCGGKNNAMYGPIIFSAYSTSGYFGSGSYITGFTGFFTNIGESFKLADGTFKAPRNGIYEFSASAQSMNINNRLTIVKNEAQILTFFNYSGNEKGHMTLTFNWITELQKGDRIRLQVSSGNFRCNSYYGNCIFNGKFLY